MRPGLLAALLLLLLTPSAWAEQLVAEQSGVRLYSSLDEQGRVCQRLDGRVVADLSCVAPPTDPEQDPGVPFRAPRRSMIGQPPTAWAGLVTPGTASLSLDGRATLPTFDGASPLARHVLVVDEAGVLPNTVAVFDAGGALRAAADVRNPPFFAPGYGNGVGLRAQASSAEAASLSQIDAPASRAAGRVVRRDLTCISFYADRAPRSKITCFRPERAGPCSYRGTYGQYILGLASKRIASIEVRDRKGRRIIKRPVARLTPALGGGSAFVTLLPGGASAPRRILLRDERGRVLVDRRGTPPQLNGDGCDAS